VSCLIEIFDHGQRKTSSYLVSTPFFAVLLNFFTPTVIYGLAHEETVNYNP